VHQIGPRATLNARAVGAAFRYSCDELKHSGAAMRRALLIAMLLAVPLSAGSQQPSIDYVGRYVCTLALTPGDTSWDTLTSASFYDTTAEVSTACPASLKVQEVWCYNPSANTAWIALAARAAGDATVGAIICPGGGGLTGPVRGLRGPTGAGVVTVSAKVGDAADTLYLTIYGEP